MKIFRQVDNFKKKIFGRAKYIAGPTSLKSGRAMALLALPIAHFMKEAEEQWDNAGMMTGKSITENDKHILANRR